MGRTWGFEQKLWAAADKLRGHMDAAEYKHVVLGLIFLKYISDAFQKKYKQLSLLKQTEHADPEDRDEYRAENVFWVPKQARWSHLKDNAKQPTIGKLIDEAMEAIEKFNPSLKGVLPKDHNRPALDKHRLGDWLFDFEEPESNDWLAVNQFTVVEDRNHRRPDWHHDDDKGILKVVMTGSASDEEKPRPHIRNKPRREVQEEQMRVECAWRWEHGRVESNKTSCGFRGLGWRKA